MILYDTLILQDIVNLHFFFSLACCVPYFVVRVIANYLTTSETPTSTFAHRG